MYTGVRVHCVRCTGEIDTDPEEQRRIEEHQRKREEAQLRAARVEAKSRRCAQCVVVACTLLTCALAGWMTLIV